jgi:hypothetical protein
MKIASRFAVALLTLFLLTSVAYADDIAFISGSVSLADPTQQGRLSRNGVPTTWAGPTFPGVINLGVTYHYASYFVNVGVTPYIEITIDSVSPNTFLAAYLDSYNPANMAATYIGDPGTSGNSFGGTDPLSFQVYVPLHHQLLLVVNNTAAGNVGVGDPYNIYVQGYLDTLYTSTPEPSSLVLLGSGVVGLAGLVRRKLNLG